ncbi:hypothetical protein [Rubellimicrobium sp. CFH 75288]|uniref:hypothetical protein n=1 Tax=Rubellimicrobium sp. CFH 75288 TaxID=2697034 RepID=UPI00141350E8|nr:hypothetical protein [Rubellimicrobium sp. CFH 75288]NAZ35793.1 hypothetical protein [Rubellimicrobium sp. CFH 75288]
MPADLRGLALVGLMAAATAWAAPAAAGSCVARVNGQELIIVPEDWGAARPGLRERLLTWPQRNWDRAWGERTACDSAVVTRFLAETMRLDQTEGYCLAPGEEGWLLVPGARNWRGRCTATTCERIGMAADGAVEIGRRVAGLALGNPPPEADRGRLEAIAHGTGALLLRGQAGAVAGALGQAAGALGTALASPAAAGAAAVTVMAVGGAVYLCSD